jgi:hypothetical protein
MTDRFIRNLTIALLAFVGITLSYFLVSTIIDGYSIWSSNKIDFAVTEQVGDFVGGFLGTVINGAAFYFLYLNLNEQRKSGEKQGFETKIFELIRLHRENVSELRYTKNGHQAEARKVFRIIAKECIECLHEVKRFAKMYPNLSVLKPEYNNLLENIRKENNIKAKLMDLVLIDLAYNFIYFGLSKESETVLHHKFYRRYNREYIYKLSFFIKLKPKKDNEELYQTWMNFKEQDVKDMRNEFENLYDNRKIYLGSRKATRKEQDFSLSACLNSVS